MLRLMNREGLKILFVITIFGLSAYGCSSGSANIPPEESPEVVVERFYEYISEAKTRGGGIPIREAYKLISAENSKLSEAKFQEIIGKYPPGFRADIVKSEINGSHASVTIQYKMASIFGGEYTNQTTIPMILDKKSNTWKIDFTGETDLDDKATLRKECNVC